MNDTLSLPQASLNIQPTNGNFEATSTNFLDADVDRLTEEVLRANQQLTIGERNQIHDILAGRILIGPQVTQSQRVTTAMNTYPSTPPEASESMNPEHIAYAQAVFAAMPSQQVGNVAVPAGDRFQTEINRNGSAPMQNMTPGHYDFSLAPPPTVAAEDKWSGSRLTPVDIAAMATQIHAPAPGWEDLVAGVERTFQVPSGSTTGAPELVASHSKPDLTVADVEAIVGERKGLMADIAKWTVNIRTERDKSIGAQPGSVPDPRKNHS